MFVALLVYGDPHLGHARPAITFDVVYRYLQLCGYKVRYVKILQMLDILKMMLMKVKTK